VQKSTIPDAFLATFDFQTHIKIFVSTTTPIIQASRPKTRKSKRILQGNRKTLAEESESGNINSPAFAMKEKRLLEIVFLNVTSE
jgi:hypothetical protein